MGSWIITNSRGDVVANVGDGTLNDTSTDIALIGKNYAFYGQPQNENFVYMLEHFANDTAPEFPIQGQIWFNTATNQLAVYNTVGSWANIVGDQNLGSMATQNSNDVVITGGNISGITDLAVADGGTGASTAADARTNLGLGTMAVQDANNVAITGGSITGITPLAVEFGGTGGNNLSSIYTSLGLGTLATQNANNVNITGGSITGISAIPITSGGTGSSTASGARTNLGLGSMATQSSAAVDIVGGTITGITPIAIAAGGTGAGDAGTARTNLGLGSMATQAASNVAITGGSITGISALPVASGGTGANTAADARTNLGLGSMATQSSSSVSISGGSITGIADPGFSGTMTAGTISATGTITGANLALSSGWSITEIGGTLYFQLNGVNKAALDSSGNFTSIGDVTGFGTL